MLDFTQANQAFERTNNILILPSQPVDGDSISSALALYSVLKAKGKNATIVLTAEVPDNYKFLPGVENIVADTKIYSDFVVTIDLRDTKVSNVEHEILDNKINLIITPEKGTILSDQVSFPKPERKYDLLVVLDAADLTQLGDFYIQNYAIFNEVPSINIDHHKSNNRFASLNLVDPLACSTTHVLHSLFKTMGVELNADLATLLLAGIITDTGSFQNDNTTPEAFDLAADLIDLGARQQEIIKHVYKTKQLQTLKLWGKILSSIQVDAVNRLVWSKATQMDFSETGTTEKDTGDIIDDLLSNAEEADTVLLLIENADGSVHGSIRTTNDSKDASQIAQQFGGGGHAKSAGFTLYNTNITQAEQLVLSKLTNPMPAVETAPELVESQEPVLAEPNVTPEIDPVEKLTRDFVSKPATENSEDKV